MRQNIKILKSNQVLDFVCKSRILLLLLFAFSSSVVQAANWYVNDNSTAGDKFTTAVGSATGTGSKSSPFLTLTKAMQVAAPGDTIIVDVGTFLTEKNIAFNKANITVIGAGVTKTVFNNNYASASSNQFGTISAINVVFKNFEVTKYNYSLGGANGKALTITGSGAIGVVLDGVLVDNNGSSGGNGAIMIANGAKATIKNGADSCNLPTGLYGGGTDVDGIGTELSIVNQYISKNARAGGNGGAINITNGGKVTVSNSVFDGNSAINGGAIFVDGGTLIVTNTIFKNNIADQTSSTAEGGAIAIGKNSIVTISNTEFTSNKAGIAAATSGLGGAISLNTNLGSNTLTTIVSKLNLTNVSFTGNTVTKFGRHIYGDESSSKQAEIVLNNVSFSGTGTSTDIYQKTVTEIVFSISNSGNPTKTNVDAAQQLNTTNPTSFVAPTVPNASGSCVAFNCAAESYAPVIIECVPNKTIAQANCTATLLDYTAEVVASDDCTITKTQSPAAGTNLAVGVNTITVTVTDASGNTATCTFTVTVTPQATPNAGTNGTLSICSTTVLTSDTLFASLGGSPSIGGTWSPAIAGAGTYTYTVNTCPGEATATVTVTAQSAPNAGNSGTLQICAGAIVTAEQLFSSLNGTPDTTGTWSPALAGAGTYTYTVAAISPCTENATSTVTVSELQLNAPVISASSLSFCVGKSVTLTATGCTGQIIWSNGETGPTLTVSTPGTYSAQCSSSGCLSTASNSLTILENELPTILINEGVSSISACEGSVIRLTASGGTQYSWSNGMITPYIDVSATNGTYTVVGKNENGCENETTITIIANPVPTITITGATSFCSNATSVLTASGGVSYSWNTGATTSEITLTTAGTYTVTITDENGCTASKSLTVATYSCPPPCPTNGNLLANGSFESPQITSNYVIIQQQNWTNLVDGGVIETWKNGFLGVPPVNGTQIIELNAFQLGTIVQTATVSTDVPLTVSYYHRSRNNSGQRIRLEIKDLTTNQIIHTFTSTSNLTWQKFSTTFSTANPSIQVRFVSLNVCTGDAGCGNLMDHVVLNYASCLCDSVPNNPTITASVTEVDSTTSSILTATGCAGGTIKWSNGQTGASITTNVPGEYFAQCVIDNCESIPSNKIILNATSDVLVTCPTFQWRSNGVFHVNYCVKNNGNAPISGTAYVKVAGEIVYSDTYTNLLPGASVCFTYRKRFIPCGTVFAATVGATLVGTDSNVSNNECSGSQTMSCVPNPPPYDPNFKDVEPKRNLEGGIFMSDEWLTYTVHCQNDGAGRAVDVVMLDYIDTTKLDISTVQLLSSTHPVEVVTHLPNRIGFEFHNIQLANSALDLAGSQAEVRFKIKRLPNQTVGTIIENQVGIFFDHEAEVKTNIIASKIIEPCPSTDLMTGIVSNNQTIMVGSTPSAFVLSNYNGIITGWEVATNPEFTVDATTKYNTYSSGFSVSTPLNSTTYVRALVQTGSCQIAGSEYATITVLQPLSATATANPITCNGGTTNVVVSPIGGLAPYTITPSQENLSAGNYVFTVTDSNNSTSTVAIELTEPQSEASIVASSGTAFCIGTTNILRATGGNSYLWNTGATTSTIEVTNSGIYTVTITNNEVCSVRKIEVTAYNCETSFCPESNNLLVNGSFENPAISSSWTIATVPSWTNLVDNNKIEVHKNVLNIPIPNGKQYIELNGSVLGKIYQDVIVQPNKALKLSFMYRARTTARESIRVTLIDPTTNSNSYSFTSTAIYNVWKDIIANYTTANNQTKVRVFIEALSGFSSGSGNLIDDVKLNYVDCLNPSATIIGNNEICNGNDVVLSLANTTNIASYLWSNGSTNPIISVNQPGIYSVVVTLNDGSSITSSNFVVTNCTTMNGNSSKNTTDVDTVVNNFNVVLYPNPVINEFSIQLISTSKENVEILIYDIQGRIIERKLHTKDELNNLKFGVNLPNGIYNVVIKQGNLLKSQRLIKS